VTQVSLRGATMRHATLASQGRRLAAVVAAKVSESDIGLDE